MPTTMVNEDRLFQLIPSFFERPENVLLELAQNASRSKATKLDITLNESILTVHDNGEGTYNYTPLLVLADSDWSANVTENQNPAGWGNFYLISLSSEITFRSLFGSLKIDCQRFLTERNYRENIFTHVNPSDNTPGFFIKAVLMPEAAKRIEETLRFAGNLEYFPLDITVNGNTLQKRNIEDKINECKIKTTFKGNKIGISPFGFSSFPESPSELAQQIKTIWYGIPINNSTYSAPVAIINIENGSPVTPVLPYRHTLQVDEKMKELYEFIKTETVKYCISFINDTANKEAYDLEKLVNLMQRIATQAEIDMLERYCLESYNPHYNSDTWGYSTRKVVVVNKNSKVESESVKLFINEKLQKYDEDDIFLPEDAVVSIRVPEKKPSWLEIQEKQIDIKITTTLKAEYEGHYTWKEAVISCDGKDINVIAIVEGSGDGTIYYTDTPKDFYEVEEAVFTQKEFYDDEDTYDSQKHYFDKTISEDIQNATGSYNLFDLLKSLSIVDVIPTEVTSITVDKEKKIMKITTDKDEKVLNISGC